VLEIYRATAQLKEQLTADQLLLINQWVDLYNKVPEPVLKQLKQEVNMEQVETTISEHIYNQGKIEGRTEGRTEGRAEGRTEGRAEGRTEGRAEGRAESLREHLAVLESLCRQGILSEAQLAAVTVPLRQTQTRSLT
jgi:flagellar biosynthesis/type III secretory pathway protein FliH